MGFTNNEPLIHAFITSYHADPVRANRLRPFAAGIEHRWSDPVSGRQKRGDLVLRARSAVNLSAFPAALRQLIGRPAPAAACCTPACC